MAYPKSFPRPVESDPVSWSRAHPDLPCLAECPECKQISRITQDTVAEIHRINASMGRMKRKRAADFVDAEEVARLGTDEALRRAGHRQGHYDRKVEHLNAEARAGRPTAGRIFATPPPPLPRDPGVRQHPPG